jgi:hypothetical protein
MGYRISFICSVVLIVLLVVLSLKFDVWSSSDFWNEANKYGIICTVIGTLFTFGTFFYVQAFSKKLQRRYRIPEAHTNLVRLVVDIRAALKEWNVKGPDALDLILEAQGRLVNLEKKLDGVERTEARQIISSIQRSGLVYLFRRKIDLDTAWRIHRRLHIFATMLGEMHQDDEVERL